MKLASAKNIFRRTLFFNSDKLPPPQRGFTLIEVLIGVLIIMLMTGYGIANYRRLEERQRAEGAAKTVEQAIRDTQKRASAGVKPLDIDVLTPPNNCGDNSTDLDGYQLSFGGTNYTISAVCHNLALPYSEQVVNATLPNGTSFTNAGNISIQYNLLGEANISQRVCVQGGGFTFGMDVDLGGSVSFLGEGVGGCP